MVSTNVKPTSYYIGNKSQRVQEILEGLTETWGSRLENLDEQWKLLFRAALANYQAIYKFYDEDENIVSCAVSCTIFAGGDDLNVWEKEPELMEYIQAIADEFSESDIEGLIEALTMQIRG